MFAAWLAILLLPLFVLSTELEPQRYVFSEDELNDINKRMGEIDKSWNLNHPAVLEFLERLYLHPELAEQPASAFLNPQPKAKRRRKRQPPPAASAGTLPAASAEDDEPSFVELPEPGFVELPEPPKPGDVVKAGTPLLLHCTCASGFEVGPSNTLPIEIPSAQAMNARCGATRVSIKLAPNPVRTMSFVPPKGSLTLDQIGDAMLRLPFSRGVAHSVREAGESVGERTYLLADPQAIPWAKVTRHHFSEPEGRTTRHVVGTPGGDLAELFLALQLVESAVHRV